MPINTLITVGLGLFILALPLLISATMILVLSVAHAPTAALTPLLALIASGLAAGLWLLNRKQPYSAF